MEGRNERTETKGTRHSRCQKHGCEVLCRNRHCGKLLADFAGSDGKRLPRFSVLMESATLWKVDATEAALLAEAGLDRFP
jgi:hypothetical protein